MPAAITVVNESPDPIECFISKYSNDSGDDSWFKLNPGARDTWSRNGWELVAFKDSGNNRAGVYVRTGTVVKFHNLNNIEVN